MSTQTPTSHAGANHEPDDQLDTGVDTAMHLRVNAREAEDEVILKQLLGVDVNQSANTIARTVGSNIFAIVSGTRHHLDQSHFQQQLEEKIQSAIDRAHPHNKPRKMEAMWNKPKHGGESAYNEKVKIVVDAIRELLPAEMLQNFVRNSEILRINTQAAVLDFTHTFWKENIAKPEADIVKALTGKNPEDVGVSGAGVVVGTALSRDIAESVAAFAVRHQLLNVLSDGSENTMGMAFAGQLLNDHPNLALVIRGKSTKEIEDKLQQSERNLDLFHAIASLEKVEKDMGTKTVDNFSTLLQEIQDKQNHRDFGKKEFVIDGHRFVPDSSDIELVEFEPDTDGVCKSINNEIETALKDPNLGNAPIIVGGQTFTPYGNDPARKQDYLRRKLQEFHKENDIKISGFRKEKAKIEKNIRENKNSFNKKLEELRKQYVEQSDPLKKIKGKMKQIVDVLAAHSVPSKGSSLETALANFDNIAPADLNIQAYVKDFKDKYGLSGKTSEDLDKDLITAKNDKKNPGALKGDMAQHAIVKEYLKKFKNMNETDANKTAGYILARSLLDNDMMHSVEELAQEIAGPAVDPTDQLFTWFGNMQHLSFNAEGRANQIVGHIAEACHISTRRQYRQTDFRLTNQPTNFTVNWGDALYPDLISAYFSIKKLKDGGGPKGISLKRQTKFVQQTMKDISKVLLSRHAAKMVLDFGPAIADKVGTEKAAELKASPLREEHMAMLAELLEGTPPEKYKHKIDAAIDRANGRTDWWRRSVLAPATFGTGKLLAGAVWTNKKWSARNAVVKTSSTAVSVTKKTASWVNKNKYNIAFLALGSVVAGPIIAAGALALKGAVSPSAAGAHGGGGEHH